MSPVQSTKPLRAAATSLGWLLDFAARDLDTLSRPAVKQLARSALAFLRTAGSRPSAWSEDRGGGGRECRRRPEPSLGDPDPLPALRTRQDRTRALLAALLVEHGAPVDARLELRLAEVGWRPGGTVTWRVGGDESQRFDGAIALALQRDCALLRRCPGRRCGELFVKRHRQRFCSQPCGQRERFDRYVERHGMTTIRQRRRQHRADQNERVLGHAIVAPTMPAERVRRRRFARRHKTDA
jgi:hypothetical protein